MAKYKTVKKLAYLYRNTKYFKDKRIDIVLKLKEQSINKYNSIKEKGKILLTGAQEYMQEWERSNEINKNMISKIYESSIVYEALDRISYNKCIKENFMTIKIIFINMLEDVQQGKQNNYIQFKEMQKNLITSKFAEDEEFELSILCKFLMSIESVYYLKDKIWNNYKANIKELK